MVAGRKPPGSGDDLARLVAENLAATRRMEQAFVALGKRVKDGNDIQSTIIELMRSLLETQRRQAHLIHTQTRLLVDQARLLHAVLNALGQHSGNEYPALVGVTVTPVG